jgi:hypothetical protein
VRTSYPKSARTVSRCLHRIVYADFANYDMAVFAILPVQTAEKRNVEPHPLPYLPISDERRSRGRIARAFRRSLRAAVRRSASLP